MTVVRFVAVCPSSSSSLLSDSLSKLGHLVQQCHSLRRTCDPCRRACQSSLIQSIAILNEVTSSTHLEIIRADREELISHMQ